MVPMARGPPGGGGGGWDLQRWSVCSTWCRTGTSAGWDVQVAMVTGGAQGLGLSFAEALGEAGASVSIVDINGKKAEAAAAHLQERGIRSIALQADVTKPDDCTRSVLQQISHLYGQGPQICCYCLSTASSFLGWM